jgi:hypothetical protein
MKLGHDFEPGLELLEFEKMRQSQNQNCTVLKWENWAQNCTQRTSKFF